MANWHSLVGSTLDHYWIIEPIAVEEGFGIIYKAFEPSTSRRVAIKVLQEPYYQDPEFLARLRSEAKIVGGLEHRNIVPVLAYGENAETGTAYLVMRYMSGGTLQDRLHRPRSLDKASRLVGQMASALDYVHGRGVVHRAVKPTNILFDADGDAYLTGFGIALSNEMPPDLTRETIGAPGYMAPEQGRGKPASPLSDQYALGVVLYKMVTGRWPFMGETPIATVKMHINDPPPAPSDFRPDLPEAAEQVILRVLAKEPNLRYSTVGEMATAFAGAIAESQ